MILGKIKNKQGFTRTPKFGVTPKGGGFTLVETMVAISLFLIVVVIGMGALLNSNLLHQKSRNMRSIMDSLSFIIEDVSRNIREGYNYRCLTGADSYSDFTPLSGEGCWGIAFESANGAKGDPGDQWVYVIGTKTMEGAEVVGIFKSVNGAAANSFVTLNPEEIDINIDSNISSFSVLGAEPPPGDSQQPFVIIKLSGTITSKGVVTPFYLQTSASQRTIDVVTGV